MYFILYHSLICSFKSIYRVPPPSCSRQYIRHWIAQYAPGLPEVMPVHDGFSQTVPVSNIPLSVLGVRLPALKLAFECMDVGSFGHMLTRDPSLPACT